MIWTCNVRACRIGYSDPNLLQFGTGLTGTIRRMCTKKNNINCRYCLERNRCIVVTKTWNCDDEKSDLFWKFYVILLCMIYTMASANPAEVVRTICEMWVGREWRISSFWPKAILGFQPFLSCMMDRNHTIWYVAESERGSLWTYSKLCIWLPFLHSAGGMMMYYRYCHKTCNPTTWQLLACCLPDGLLYAAGWRLALQDKLYDMGSAGYNLSCRVMLTFLPKMVYTIRGAL